MKFFFKSAPGPYFFNSWNGKHMLYRMIQTSGQRSAFAERSWRCAGDIHSHRSPSLFHTPEPALCRRRRSTTHKSRHIGTFCCRSARPRSSELRTNTGCERMALKTHSTLNTVIGCLHDRANIELAQACLLEPHPWLKCRPRLRLLAHSWSRVI